MNSSGATLSENGPRFEKRTSVACIFRTSHETMQLPPGVQGSTDMGNISLALYAAAGFATAGRRRAYYRRSGGPMVDALMLRALLPLRGHGNEPPSRLG
jgi:hypothetical protein